MMSWPGLFKPEHKLLINNILGKCTALPETLFNPAGVEDVDRLNTHGGRCLQNAFEPRVWWTCTHKGIVGRTPCGAGGDRQVGVGDDHALLWSGSSQSVVDLHRFVPAEYV